MSTVKLSPSILASDFTRLGEELQSIERAGASFAHVDVMDGVFVPNLSMGLPVLAAARRATRLFLDVHLMITQPERYLEEFAAAGADGISVHVEATAHAHRAVTRIRELGKHAGIALNPGTPLEAVRPLLPHVDLVLVMSVNPGFGGQKFIPESVERVRTLRGWLNDLGSGADIEVDGGVDATNARRLAEAGATVLVAGSAVFGPDGAEAGVRRLQDSLA